VSGLQACPIRLRRTSAEATRGHDKLGDKQPKLQTAAEALYNYTSVGEVMIGTIFTTRLQMFVEALAKAKARFKRSLTSSTKGAFGVEFSLRHRVELQEFFLRILTLLPIFGLTLSLSFLIVLIR
jgi:hypothetical protein